MKTLPAFPANDDVTDTKFAVHLYASDERLHALRFEGGALVEWSDEAVADDAPVLGVTIPSVLATADVWPTLPFADDSMLASALPFDALRLTFEPLGAPEFAAIGDLSTHWLLRDTPFGHVSSTFEIVDGHARRGFSTAQKPERARWNTTAEIDFVDYVDFLLGDLEVRDLIARGNMSGSVGALSTVTWLAGRDDAIAQARAQLENARLVRDWAAIIRSDDVREWVEREFSSR